MSGEPDPAEQIRRALLSAKHPAMDCSLVDLGIVKDVTADDGEVIVTVALPFSNIPAPIKDHLIRSVKDPIEKLGARAEVALTVMDQEELQRFLAVERRHFGAGT